MSACPVKDPCRAMSGALVRPACQCDDHLVNSGGAVHGDLIVVPDVVGLVVDDARAYAAERGVVLATLDADGPPLAALTWQQPVVVVSQDPPAGTPLPLWHSVVVTWAAREDPASVRQPHRPRPQNLPDTAAELPHD